MCSLFKIFVGVALVVIPALTTAQLQVKNYNIGYRVFEINGVGNNPTTIALLLKDPNQYLRFLGTIRNTTLSGSPGIQRLRNYYINVELYKPASSSFWKKNTLQTGLFITNKLLKDGMQIGDEEVTFTSNDTIIKTNIFSLAQRQQFFGADLGLRHRLRISNGIRFITGLHLQASIATSHYYNQQWDSTTFSFRNGRTTKTTILPNLEGTNFLQWQAMIPLGFDFNVYDQKLLLRLEGNVGIIRGRYRRRDFTSAEAHGLALSVIYQR